MSEVANYVIKVVLSVGGIGVIITAVTAFISRFWADLFIKKKLHEYDKKIEEYKAETNKNIEVYKCHVNKDIEQYKKEMDLQIEKYKSMYEQVLHNKSLVFDDEYKKYLELIPILTSSQPIIENAFLSKKEDDLEKAKEKSHIMSQKLSEYSTFIEKEIYTICCNYSKKYKMVVDDNHMLNKTDKEEQKDYDYWRNDLLKCIKDLQNIQKDLEEKFREYKQNSTTINP